MPFVLFIFLAPWPADRGRAVAPIGLAACAAILGCGFGVALLMPSFGGVLNIPAGPTLMRLGWGVVAASLVPLALLALRRRRYALRPLQRKPFPLALRFVLSAAFAAALLLTWGLARAQGMPAFVDLPRMFGWPVLALAAAAFIALPLLASPLANLAAALACATFPFVVFNPLRSDFLPHRTAVFLGFALAALAGTAAAGLAHAGMAAWHARPKAASKANPSKTRPILFAAPALLFAVLLGGAVYAGTPDSYPGGWYRLYNPCELDGLRDIAARADANPAAILVVGDWQSKLVLSALASDAARVWYKAEVFTSDKVRGDFLANMAHSGRPVLVVVDRYLRSETPDAQTDFLLASPWQAAGSWCAGMGLPQARLTAFSTGGFQ